MRPSAGTDDRPGDPLATLGRAVGARRSAGLAPWAFGALFSVVGFCLLLVVLGGGEEGRLSDRREAQDLALIETFRASSAPLKVAILGNSRLRYATVAESELAALMGSRDRETAFVRLFKNNAVFGDFGHVLAPLLDAAPDLILIQAPLLLQEPAGANYGLIPQYIRWRLVGGTIDGADPLEAQQKLICLEDLSERTQREFRTRIDAHRRYEPDGANARAAGEFLAEARGRGISVIVVTTPVTSPLAEFLEASGRTDLLRAHALVRADGAWEFSREMPDAAFCDPMHLDVAGRRVYSEWLAEHLVRWLSRDRRGMSVANRSGTP